MNLEARALQALYASARRQRTLHESDLVVRLGVSPGAAHAAVCRLHTAGLTETRPSGTLRLTLAGLAVASALRSPSKARMATWTPGTSRAA